MPTILITGFGPFPGAPYNPTERLVRDLARLRRPALAQVTLIGHVFETSYAAVDRGLPELIARYKPDALLMFGLHGRAGTIRIETRARNALALLPDASGKALRRGVIEPDAPFSRRMPMPAQALLAAAHAAHVPAVLSRDAGRYLCNYLCWRASEAVGGNGPKLAAFVHVPLVRRPAALGRRLVRKDGASRMVRGDERIKHRFTAADLFRTGQNVLLALVSAVNRS